MQFKEGAQVFSYEIQREGGEDVMYLNYMGAPYVPNLAVSGEVMARTVDALVESSNVSRIVFVQQRNYNYDFQEVSLLLEVAQLYIYLVRQEGILSYNKLVLNSPQFFTGRYNEIFGFLSLLKADPVSAYVELKNILTKARIFLDNVAPSSKACQMNYIRLVERLVVLVENLQVIKLTIPHLDGYRKGDRDIYNYFFKPDIIPNFTFTRLVENLPEDAEIISQYVIAQGQYDESNVTILKRKGEAKLTYHLQPPEFLLSEDYNVLLNLARSVLIEHQPQAEEFTDTERTRQVFFNISRDLLQDLANTKGIALNFQDVNRLATILVRHTIGFGLIEVLLQDKYLQDIVLNAPIPLTPVFVRHADFDECVTNIFPSQEDADSWAAKFRMISGRPLDEANPILDTQLNIGSLTARIAIIQQPLSPNGLAYALRRFREQPWTLPLFVKNRMINSFTAGLLSFLIDGSRTLLVAGTRSSGKTSLLGALMLEIIPRYRIIVVEDSVAGDSRMIVKENGKFKKTTIGELIDEQIRNNGFRDWDGREKAFNQNNLEIFSIDKNGKVILTEPSFFVRHKVTKPIYEVITTSGKKIKVTEDHSLFTLDEKNILKPIKTKDLKEGDFLAVPDSLPFDNCLEYIDLLDHLNSFDKKIFVGGEGVEKYILENRQELFSFASSLNYRKSTIQNWSAKKILPVDIFEKIKDKIDRNNLWIKSMGGSGKLPVKIDLDEDFLSFLGLWLADGCYDRDSVIVSVQEEENRNVVRKIAEKFNLNVKIHSDSFSLMLNSGLLKQAMKNVFEMNGNSYTKKIPSWCYNLSDRQTGALLKGFFKRAPV